MRKNGEMEGRSEKIRRRMKEWRNEERKRDRLKPADENINFRIAFLCDAAKKSDETKKSQAGDSKWKKIGETIKNL